MPVGASLQNIPMKRFWGCKSVKIADPCRTRTSVWGTVDFDFKRVKCDPQHHCWCAVSKSFRGVLKLVRMVNTWMSVGKAQQSLCQPAEWQIKIILSIQSRVVSTNDHTGYDVQHLRKQIMEDCEINERLHRFETNNTAADIGEQQIQSYDLDCKVGETRLFTWVLSVKNQSKPRTFMFSENPSLW